ncbi:hypothetical protein CMQ_5348 [Grosmannia clavigera kw1407]|uniref:Uncharacterized protein n=1 Tax=Grosmannia clavigera (strain kw1407 / UAMH 11150) TaxID=655863 RepID=F0XBT6_GROCL|nr:uncharacterized protein CMQ_5348 [Grosmannia clavigera kw1407]EFX05086.1 hypothetical protein CMQ_5348 [Grosmannia clavigera kw1407]
MGENKGKRPESGPPPQHPGSTAQAPDFDQAASPYGPFPGMSGPIGSPSQQRQPSWGNRSPVVSSPQQQQPPQQGQAVQHQQAYRGQGSQGSGNQSQVQSGPGQYQTSQQPSWHGQPVAQQMPQQKQPVQQPVQQQQPLQQSAPFPIHGQPGGPQFVPEGGWKLKESHLQEPLASTRQRSSPTTPTQQYYGLDKEAELLSAESTAANTIQGTGQPEPSEPRPPAKDDDVGSPPIALEQQQQHVEPMPEEEPRPEKNPNPEEEQQEQKHQEQKHQEQKASSREQLWQEEQQRPRIIPVSDGQNHQHASNGDGPAAPFQTQQPGVVRRPYPPAAAGDSNATDEKGRRFSMISNWRQSIHGTPPPSSHSVRPPPSSHETTSDRTPSLHRQPQQHQQHHHQHSTVDKLRGFLPFNKGKQDSGSRPQSAQPHIYHDAQDAQRSLGFQGHPSRPPQGPPLQRQPQNPEQQQQLILSPATHISNPQLFLLNQEQQPGGPAPQNSSFPPARMPQGFGDDGQNYGPRQIAQVRTAPIQQQQQQQQQQVFISPQQANRADTFSVPPEEERHSRRGSGLLGFFGKGKGKDKHRTSANMSQLVAQPTQLAQQFGFSGPDRPGGQPAPRSGWERDLGGRPRASTTGLSFPQPQQQLSVTTNMPNSTIPGLSPSRAPSSVSPNLEMMTTGKVRSASGPCIPASRIHGRLPSASYGPPVRKPVGSSPPPLQPTQPTRQLAVALLAPNPDADLDLIDRPPSALSEAPTAAANGDIGRELSHVPSPSISTSTHQPAADAVSLTPSMAPTPPPQQQKQQFHRSKLSSVVVQQPEDMGQRLAGQYPQNMTIHPQPGLGVPTSQPQVTKHDKERDRSKKFFGRFRRPKSGTIDPRGPPPGGPEYPRQPSRQPVISAPMGGTFRGSGTPVGTVGPFVPPLSNLGLPTSASEPVLTREQALQKQISQQEVRQQQPPRPIAPFGAAYRNHVQTGEASVPTRKQMQNTHGEPQYGNVAIPMGYATVYSEDMMARSHQLQQQQQQRFVAYQPQLQMQPQQHLPAGVFHGQATGLKATGPYTQQLQGQPAIGFSNTAPDGVVRQNQAVPHPLQQHPVRYDSPAAIYAEVATAPYAPTPPLPQQQQQQQQQQPEEQTTSTPNTVSPPAVTSQQDPVDSSFLPTPPLQAHPQADQQQELQIPQAPSQTAIQQKHIQDGRGLMAGASDSAISSPLHATPDSAPVQPNGNTALSMGESPIDATDASLTDITIGNPMAPAPLRIQSPVQTTVVGSPTTTEEDLNGTSVREAPTAAASSADSPPPANPVSPSALSTPSPTAVSVNGSSDAESAKVGRQKTIRQTSAQQVEEYKRRQMLKDLEEKIPVFVPDMDEQLEQQRRKEREQPHMSATSYPGQEWNPYAEFTFVEDDLM